MPSGGLALMATGEAPFATPPGSIVRRTPASVTRILIGPSAALTVAPTSMVFGGVPGTSSESSWMSSAPIFADAGSVTRVEAPPPTVRPWSVSTPDDQRGLDRAAAAKQRAHDIVANRRGGVVDFERDAEERERRVRQAQTSGERRRGQCELGDAGGQRGRRIPCESVDERATLDGDAGGRCRQRVEPDLTQEAGRCDRLTANQVDEAGDSRVGARPDDGGHGGIGVVQGRREMRGRAVDIQRQKRLLSLADFCSCVVEVAGNSSCAGRRMRNAEGVGQLIGGTECAQRLQSSDGESEGGRKQFVSEVGHELGARVLTSTEADDRSDRGRCEP